MLLQEILIRPNDGGIEHFSPVYKPAVTAKTFNIASVASLPGDSIAGGRARRGGVRLRKP